MRSRKPESSSVYIFGSFLSSNTPSDIDILVLYDPVYCVPDRAYEAHETEIEYISSQVKLKPHVVLLTYEEEHDVGFMMRYEGVKAVESFAWY
jgi:predicted nucleotidyltransferase